MVYDHDSNGKKLKFISGIFLGVFALIAVILSVCRFWLISSFYNTSTGYYDGAGNSVTVITCAVYISVIAAIVCGVFFAKKIEITAHDNSKAVIVSNVVCGAMIAVSIIISLTERSFSDYGGLDCLSLIFIIPTISCFFIRGFIKIGYTARTLLNSSVIVWSAVNLLRLYFDLTYTINNPAKISEQLFLISVMIFFLFECREFLGKARPSAYLATGNIAIVLGAVSVLPNVLAYFMYGYELATVFSSQIAELGLLIYVAVKTVVNVHSIAIKKNVPSSKGEKKAK